MTQHIGQHDPEHEQIGQRRRNRGAAQFEPRQAEIAEHQQVVGKRIDDHATHRDDEDHP